MSSLEVDVVTYSDADFNLSQSQPFANGLASVGTNPLHLQVRSAASDPTVWIEATSTGATPAGGGTANGWITTSGGGATVTIYIPQSQLATLPAGAYVYSLIMSVNATLRTEVFRGTWTHNIGPTQWPAKTA